MTEKIDLNKYQDFVEAVTSKESNNYDHLHRRIEELRDTALGINPSLLLTAGIGLARDRKSTRLNSSH